ncbi:MAG: polysaccharide deacetylase family protein [Clostridia bacterium]
MAPIISKLFSINNTTNNTKVNAKHGYIGSVLFFKHLIFCFIVILCIVPIILLFGFIHQSNEISAKTLASEDDFLLTKPRILFVETPAPESATQGLMNLDQQASFPYQAKYPELYCQMPLQTLPDEKTLYLTFDDGPSSYTGKILDELKKQNIKATFFILGNKISKNIPILKRIIAEGHSIGIHTYSHNYKTIYFSVDSYLADFKKSYDLIYNEVGIKPTIFRFPGGSINTYNRNIYQPIIAEMTRRGFTYYDWNISAEDATDNSSPSLIKDNILKNVAKTKHGIILMHDKENPFYYSIFFENTITALKTSGYKFLPIDNTVVPVSFAYLP